MGPPRPHSRPHLSFLSEILNLVDSVERGKARLENVKHRNICAPLLSPLSCLSSGVCKHSHRSFYIRVIYIETNKHNGRTEKSSEQNLTSYLFIMLLTAYIGRRDSPDKSSDLNKYTIKSYIYLIYYVINFVKMMYQCISQ